MVDAITATYSQHDGDWMITVSAGGRELTAHAPGIIAARDRADQLAAKLASESDDKTVVHLLNGNALDFTAAYMQARLGRSVPVEEEDQPEADTVEEPPAEDLGSAHAASEDAADESDEAAHAVEEGPLEDSRPPALDDEAAHA
jgi:hypothetical protein